MVLISLYVTWSICSRWSVGYHTWHPNTTCSLRNWLSTTINERCYSGKHSWYSCSNEQWISDNRTLTILSLLNHITRRQWYSDEAELQKSGLMNRSTTFYKIKTNPLKRALKHKNNQTIAFWHTKFLPKTKPNVKRNTVDVIIHSMQVHIYKILITLAAVI